MSTQNQGQPNQAPPKPAKLKASYRLTIDKEYLYSLTAQFLEFYFTKNKTDAAVKNFVNNFFGKAIIGQSLPVLDIPFYINALNPNTLPAVIANQLSPRAVSSLASHKKAIMSYFNELLAIAMHSPIPTEVMPLGDFAKHLGVSGQTVNAILEEKRIPYYTLSSKKRMISVTDYNSFLASIKTSPLSVNAAVDNPDAENTTQTVRQAGGYQKNNNDRPSKNPRGNDKDKQKPFTKNNAPKSNQPPKRDEKTSSTTNDQPRKPFIPTVESADSFSNEFGTTLKKKMGGDDVEQPVISDDNNTPEVPAVKESDAPQAGGDKPETIVVEKTAENKNVVEQPAGGDTAEHSKDVKEAKPVENTENGEKEGSVVEQARDGKTVEDEKATSLERLEGSAAEQPSVEQSGGNSDNPVGKKAKEEKRLVVDSDLLDMDAAATLNNIPVPSPSDVKITESVGNDDSQIDNPDFSLPEIPPMDEKEDRDSLPTFNISLDNMADVLSADDVKEETSSNIHTEECNNLSDEMLSAQQYQGMSSEDILKSQQKLNNHGGENNTARNETVLVGGNVSEEKQRKRILIKTK